MKRANLFVAILVLVVSSFSLQDFTAKGVTPKSFAQKNRAAESQASAGTGTAQSAAQEVVPTEGVPSQIFGFRDFSKPFRASACRPKQFAQTYQVPGPR